MSTTTDQLPAPEMAAAVDDLDDPGDASFAVRAVLTAADLSTLTSARVPFLDLDFAGIVGDRHYGVARPSTSRQGRFYPRGTLIRNRRQLSLVSVEELADIADRMGLPEIRPEWFGASVLTEGLPSLSAVPPGARMLFPGGVGLVCEGVNQPCRLIAKVLQDVYPESRALATLVRQATGLRGVVASVERPGSITAGATVRVFWPELHRTN